LLVILKLLLKYWFQIFRIAALQNKYNKNAATRQEKKDFIFRQCRKPLPDRSSGKLFLAVAIAVRRPNCKSSGVVICYTKIA